MNDNYLWDRSGEPVAEIQELEEILGTLRYQPRPLEIPSHLQVGYRRRFYPAMAIAATIVLFAVLIAAWFSFNRRPAPALEAVRNGQTDQQPSNVPPANPDNARSQTAAAKSPEANETQEQRETQKHPEAPRNLLAVNKHRPNRNVTRPPVLTPQELAEKEQVLVALRLVSFKLNVAQRRTVGPPPLNTIRNQHKIG
jgi:hypothetical protein